MTVKELIEVLENPENKLQENDIVLSFLGRIIIIPKDRIAVEFIIDINK